jgi:polyribonucleotide 5'-hydroxyl-kinase
MKLSSLKFYRAGGLQLSEGMRLIGEKVSAQENTQLVRISPSPDILNSIVAVLHPVEDETGGDVDTVSSSSRPVDTPAALSQCNVAGFLWIVQLDTEADSLTVLSPCPGVLPSKHVVVGSLKWVE